MISLLIEDIYFNKIHNELDDDDECKSSPFIRFELIQYWNKCTKCNVDDFDILYVVDGKKYFKLVHNNQIYFYPLLYVGNKLWYYFKFEYKLSDYELQQICENMFKPILKYPTLKVIGSNLNYL